MNNSTTTSHSPDALADAIRRAKAEFLEMPGLKLTAMQAARLWSVDTTLSARVLSALVDARFLDDLGDATFVRTGHRV